MKKTNARSFRFTDEVYCILSEQPGENFSQKFDYLVKECYCRIEQRQAELERINNQIDQRRQELRNLEHATDELHQLEINIEETKRYFGIIERRAKSIAEKEV